MREAPSIVVSQRLVNEGAIVQAYDPVATENAKKILPEEVHYAASIQEAIIGADIAIILTEWKEIKTYALDNYSKYMKQPVIFDGRNCLPAAVQTAEMMYYSIGRPVIINSPIFN
jgi:UDPglucose 6-dehydrogenase